MARDRKIKSKKVFLASDHAGFKLKEEIKKFLIKKRKKVLDLGTKSASSVDYPDYAHLLSKKMKKSKNQFGILICGTGIGMSIVANRDKSVRAGLAFNPEIATLMRQHNNANVLVLPGRFIDIQVAVKCVDNFLSTNFESGRHKKRIDKLNKS